MAKLLMPLRTHEKKDEQARDNRLRVWNPTQKLGWTFSGSTLVHPRRYLLRQMQSWSLVARASTQLFERKHLLTGNLLTKCLDQNGMPSSQFLVHWQKDMSKGTLHQHPTPWWVCVQGPTGCCTHSCNDGCCLADALWM